MLPGIVGSCLSSSTLLLPKKSRVARVLLNYKHAIDKPGEYEVDTVRHFKYADSKTDFFRSSSELEIQTHHGYLRAARAPSHRGVRLRR